MNGDDGLMSQANRMLSREARLEDMETVARLLAEVAALRAKATAADRVRELADWYDASPNMNSNRFTADRIRRALDGDGS